MNQERIKNVEKMGNVLRERIVKMLGYNKPGHIGGSCSIADVVAALYFDKMNYSKENYKANDRDRLILSKGHAAPVQYVALNVLGIIGDEDIMHFKDLDAKLQGHPDMKKTPGVEANTGSLGQGLSMGCGIAMAQKLDKQDGRVFVIMGDAEVSEGQIWEASMTAANYKLDNVVGILDCNGLGSNGYIKDWFPLTDIKGKWTGFGWHVIEIDGHNPEEILNALDEAEKVKDKPTLIVANTLKAKGIYFAENKTNSHSGQFTKEQYEKVLSDLK